VIAVLAAGCATDKLALTPPVGVDLSGDWVLDLNLSDDPTQLLDQKEKDKKAAESRKDDEDGSTPFGKPGSTGAINQLSGSSGPRLRTDLAGADEGGGTAAIPARNDSDVPTAPARMSITQHGSQVRIQAAPAEGAAVSWEFTAGTVASSSKGGANYSAGWRGPAFVVTTRAKRGDREEDYALDSQGHLILTVQTRKLEVKLVYDRART